MTSLLAIPCYSNQVTTPTFLSIVRTIQEGFSLDVRTIVGDADIARARNVLLGEFLQSDADSLIFVDADISWHVDAFKRLMAPQVDFVCGVYRMRQDEEVYPVHWPQQRRMWVDPDSKIPLLAADMVPGGFWRLSRSCVERISANKTWITDKLFPDVRYPWVFEFEFDGKMRRSEDYSFCRKWQDLGGVIWVDPGINLGHTGTKTFDSNLMGHLARDLRRPPPHFPMTEAI